MEENDDISELKYYNWDMKVGDSIKHKNKIYKVKKIMQKEFSDQTYWVILTLEPKLFAAYVYDTNDNYFLKTFSLLSSAKKYVPIMKSKLHKLDEDSL